MEDEVLPTSSGTLVLDEAEPDTGAAEEPATDGGSTGTTAPEEGQAPSVAPGDCGCDYVATGSFDAKEKGIKPGDVVCLEGGKVYNTLRISNLEGTAASPITIRNCGGVAEIYSGGSYGIKFVDSKHFKLLGDGTSDKYGIKVTTEKGFFVSFEHLTTNFEVANVEVAGAAANGIGEFNGFAGFGIKTSPYQDCELFSDPTKTAWIMEDVSVHDNYIHDTGGEGIYMGHGFYNGRAESRCDGQFTYAHSIHNVRIYNNLIEDVGFDGIQIKNADKDVKVYNNTVRNYGTRNEGAHNEGLFLGEGTVGDFYSNMIDTGTGTGCQIQAMRVNLYNNVFLNSGKHGMYVAHGPQVKRDGDFNIFNNTIYNSAEYGFVFYNEDGGAKRFMNNLVVKSGTAFKNGAKVEMSNNLFTESLTDAGFVNINSSNAKLSSGSKAINAGKDLSSFGVTTDFNGKARSGAYDIGAYEF